MRRQLMAMVLTVTSAMTDETAKTPVEAVADVRHHAVNHRHPSHAETTGTPVCEKIMPDRPGDRNISSTDSYFYNIDH